MLRRLSTLCFFFIFIGTFAQSGGDNTYDFLNLTSSARAGALGGQQISIFDDDLTLVYFNPSLLRESMSNQITLSYVNYIADINYGYASYARSFDKIGNFGLGIHYIDYGDFYEADEYANRYGQFGAREYSINAYYSRPILDSILYVGGAIKAISSKLETYKSFGMAMDVGITYRNENHLFTAAFVMKNLGTQFTTYYDGADHEPLPFELQLGLSKKLKHAPFRFSILARHLETPNLQYKTEKEIEDEADPNVQTDSQSGFAEWGDNFMRHLVFGLEFLPTKNFHIRLGYDYKLRQELKIEDKTGFIGFSWGFGLKIYKFHISYGRAGYHLASGAKSNLFTVNVNLNEFSKKY